MLNKIKIINDANYASETYINNKIAEASLSGGEVDLSGYVTIEFDGNAYTYYIKVTSEFEGISSIKIYFYNPDGSYNSRRSYSPTGLTPEVAKAIPLPITTGTFRIRVDFLTTNTLENINSRLVITKVPK